MSFNGVYKGPSYIKPGHGCYSATLNYGSDHFPCRLGISEWLAGNLPDIALNKEWPEA
jgi:hypothetical protein